MSNDIKKTMPIGVFDSGLGGISVLREIVSLMPEENYIYYGDSAHAPYGTKPLDEIRRLSEADMSFLLARHDKAIVIACNTATAASAEILREKYPDIPIIGIEPALKPAVLWKPHDRVAVMATPMTLKQEKFQNLMHHYETASEIYTVPCPGLADLVEQYELTGPKITKYLTDILAPVLEKDIDAIVLGCTHYPFVEPVIREIVGPNVKIFNGSHGTAMELKRRLMENGIKNDSTVHGTIEIYNSNSDDKTLEMCKRLLNS